ncbi:MAG: M20/M25/M40 family metallo-hydrolase [Streptosporangiales bacterium]|nr:M20/M25/M40 family metallo-hydrolase [Streptosporangiales bacterium]
MRRLVIGSAVVLAAGLVAAPAAQAAEPKAKLPGLVTLKSVRQHQQALQRISDFNGGNRASGLPGYEISVKYVADQLKRAGYKPQVQEFEFPFFRENSPAVMEQTAPGAKTYTNATDGDFLNMEYSGPGDVTAAATAVRPGAADSGCQAADFAGFPSGNIAIVRRGTCDFIVKAQNARDAGAPAVVIFNDGASPERTGPIAGTLGGPIDIPVIGASHAAGNELVPLADAGTLRLHVRSDTFSEPRTTWNVIAETKAGRADNVVVVGAHLDSVQEGAGINDNGSGTAAILSTAQQVNKLGGKIKNKVRFAFWGAEESGLLGSEHYVANLSEAERDRIALNLNFDMLGSPNYVRLVYDGDGSDGGPAGPAGSGAIEKIFNDYYAGRDLPTDPTEFSGRSDYGPFIAVGIPAGGLFSGADAVKTERQAQIYGGTAGQILDPCYHQACDDIDNTDLTILDELTDGVAFGVERFARSTLEVNGVARTQAAFKAPARERVGEHWVR